MRRGLFPILLVACPCGFVINHMYTSQYKELLAFVILEVLRVANDTRGSSVAWAISRTPGGYVLVDCELCCAKNVLNSREWLWLIVSTFLLPCGFRVVGFDVLYLFGHPVVGFPDNPRELHRAVKVPSCSAASSLVVVLRYQWSTLVARSHIYLWRYTGVWCWLG